MTNPDCRAPSKTTGLVSSKLKGHKRPKKGGEGQGVIGPEPGVEPALDPEWEGREEYDWVVWRNLCWTVCHVNGCHRHCILGKRRGCDAGTACMKENMLVLGRHMLKNLGARCHYMCN